MAPAVEATDASAPLAAWGGGDRAGGGDSVGSAITWEGWGTGEMRLASRRDGLLGKEHSRVHGLRILSSAVKLLE